GVEGDEHHVVAVVEDLLRAVAVVVVDVEDGHALRPGVAEGLGRDGGVVEEAVAAVEVAPGMVARRPAQGEGGALAPAHQALAGDGDGGGGEGGAPGAGGDRRSGVERVE